MGGAAVELVLQFFAQPDHFRPLAGVARQRLEDRPDRRNFALLFAELVADQATYLSERPFPPEGGRSHFARGGDGPRGPVGNEDTASALLRYASGARGTLVASRVAVSARVAASSP